MFHFFFKVSFLKHPNQHACAKYGNKIVVGGGYTYYPTGNLAETSIIDISDGSNVVASAFNTLRYDFEMVNLHGLVIAFGGWNTQTGGLQDFEIWSPTLQRWARGSDVFGQYRSYYGLLTVSFRNYCYYNLEQNYEDWIGNDVKPNLDAVILAGGRF